MSKLLSVILYYEDETWIASGEEATKWAKHNEQLAQFAYVHNHNPFVYDPIDWEVRLGNNALISKIDLDQMKSRVKESEYMIQDDSKKVSITIEEDDQSPLLEDDTEPVKQEQAPAPKKRGPKPKKD